MEKDFWEDKWANGNTGWDIGYISTPIKEYVDQIANKEIRILIPGAGNAYEAEYLHHQGFSNVTVIDISEGAVNSFMERYPDFPRNHVLHKDFFEHSGEYDLIIEQTFFCAIHPEMRNMYCKKMDELLHREGKLVGLLFDFPLVDGPPFGGCKDEYVDRFTNHFSSIKIEPCRNSIEPRKGREFWVEIAK
ncbi:TPMT family class I SAM-dependent methyltransferase [Paracrocinitomix mangrovi]|uniref:methyltransferase domain-containing protein n=1 Tax=Paracrocinitomix mangrovi TaxID=2862509 RepID=UPI001C8DCA8A|nr:methyltransferase domain-containing protein [Paracrocinitomix mangrovi]UKN02496.1 TPMT family class I SAM-dependent methyltransferase [Paracrocinitomix mangrovi]